MANDEQDLLLGLISTLLGILLFVSDTPGKWIVDRLIGWFKIDPNIWSIYIKRLLGFIWLGILPLSLMLLFAERSPHLYGLINNASKHTWLSVLTLSTIIIVINFFNSQTEHNLAIYPEIRMKNWPGSSIMGSSFTWVLYLAGYEFLFRGILLFSCIKLMEPITAITLNTTLYSLFHLQKGYKETLASIPFGIILCLLSIRSQSIWPAISLHIVLALSNEWLSIYFSSDKILKGKNT